MSSGRRTSEQQATYVRQATILRKNLLEWDRMLRTPRGEDWPTMLGRLNAALNQTTNLDHSIDDVMEHFVYVPKQATANAQDIPFFLSTRLETPQDLDTDTATNSKGATSTTEQSDEKRAANEPLGGATSKNFEGDPVRQLQEYEKNAARLVALYEENMVRY
jgi:hypothetical protein